MLIAQRYTYARQWKDREGDDHQWRITRGDTIVLRARASGDTKRLITSAVRMRRHRRDRCELSHVFMR